MNTNNVAPSPESKWWVRFLLVMLAGAVVLGLLLAGLDFLSPSIARKRDAETDIYLKNKNLKFEVAKAEAEADMARIRQAPEIEAGWHQVGMNLAHTIGSVVCVAIGASMVVFTTRIAMRLLPAPRTPEQPSEQHPSQAAATPAAQPSEDEWVRTLRAHPRPSTEARVQEYLTRRNGSRPGMPVQAEAQPQATIAKTTQKTFSNNGHSKDSDPMAGGHVMTPPVSA